MPAQSEQPVQHVYAENAAEWRAWLRKNHKTARRVFLVYYKKATGKPSVTYREALMEAICFGWIDTTVERLDDERYGTNFMKRGKNVNWSSNTLAYAEQLIRQRKMSKQGLEAYQRGKLKAPIDPTPKGTPPPPELNAALDADPAARAFFDQAAPSARLVYIAWVNKAKRAETRERRIAEVVRRCAARKKWND